MIVFNNELNGTTWQSNFVAILPEIEQKLRLAFCYLDAEAREDAIDEGVVHSLLAYVRLVEQGRMEVATPSSLAWYSSRHVKRGRPAAGRMNGKELLSRYAQIGHGFKVVPLENYDPDDDTWVNDVVESRNASILDQIAIRMDFRSWLASLERRTRRIAVDLAKGFRTSEVSRKYSVTPGRISQLRRELHSSWQQFQGESALAAAL